MSTLRGWGPRLIAGSINNRYAQTNLFLLHAFIYWDIIQIYGLELLELQPGADR